MSSIAASEGVVQVHNLRDYFRDDVAALSELLGRDFGYWLETESADEMENRAAYG